METQHGAVSGTRTMNRNPLQSGMCPICISDCQFPCEVGLSAIRGREVLYPQPAYFGKSTAASEKNYGLWYSDFQLMTRFGQYDKEIKDIIGAIGIEEDSYEAIFPKVNVKTELGGIKVKLPVIMAAMGSTEVARGNWKGLAQGAAISGTILTIGENVCGMDAVRGLYVGKNGYPSDYDEYFRYLTKGKGIVDSPDMKFRIDSYREFWDGKHGDIAVQTNVEDKMFGVDDYVLSKLEVDIIERKWGQGAKAIGGEVRLNLEEALKAKKLGYIIQPDPEDIGVKEAYKRGAFKTFERHSRVGMIKRPIFIEDIKNLRSKGAKRVFLKTGSYRPENVAYTLKLASEAGIDLITFDGTGGGTGMSPVPMMRECGMPTVYLQSAIMECIKILKEKKPSAYIPDIVLAGGFASGAPIVKAISLGELNGKQYIKAIGMARAPLCAVTKAKTIEKALQEEKPPKWLKNYGTKESAFISWDILNRRFGKDFHKLNTGTIGLYTFFDTLKIEIQQLVAGQRKFDIEYLDRKDIASLTERAKNISGIPMIHEIDKQKMESILFDE